jgi:hypothetical protein
MGSIGVITMSFPSEHLCVRSTYDWDQDLHNAPATTSSPMNQVRGFVGDMACISNIELVFVVSPCAC